MRKWILMALVLLFGFNNLYPETLGEKANKMQTQIRKIQSKCKNIKNNEEFFQLRENFSPNQFLEVLTTLKLKENYTLDFIPISDMYGEFPLVIATDSADQAFFKMLYALKSKPSEDTINMIEMRLKAFEDENCTKNMEYPELPQSMSSENCIGYMKYLDVEHSELGYLEYVILSIIGNQFLLSWHAGYNDRTVITSKKDIFDNFKLDDAFLKNNEITLNEIDYEPRIEIKGDTARVRLCIFSNWGGLIEVKYILFKSDYVIIKEAKESVIIHYDCGISF